MVLPGRVCFGPALLLLVIIDKIVIKDKGGILSGETRCARVGGGGDLFALAILMTMIKI